MYSSISDCDEGLSLFSTYHISPSTNRAIVFNFWEPLHFWDRGHGFQTWEVTPKYSIRSWAYILLHIVPTRITRFVLGLEKVYHCNQRYLTSTNYFYLEAASIFLR